MCLPTFVRSFPPPAETSARWCGSVGSSRHAAQAAPPPQPHGHRSRVRPHPLPRVHRRRVPRHLVAHVQQLPHRPAARPQRALVPMRGRQAAGVLRRLELRPVRRWGGTYQRRPRLHAVQPRPRNRRRHAHRPAVHARAKHGHERVRLRHEPRAGRARRARRPTARRAGRPTKDVHGVPRHVEGRQHKGAWPKTKHPNPKPNAPNPPPTPPPANATHDRRGSGSASPARPSTWRQRCPRAAPTTSAGA